MPEWTVAITILIENWTPSGSLMPVEIVERDGPAIGILRRNLGKSLNHR
jgi:hypothetical protein